MDFENFGECDLIKICSVMILCQQLYLKKEFTHLICAGLNLHTPDAPGLCRLPLHSECLTVFMFTVAMLHRKGMKPNTVLGQLHVALQDC